MLYQLYHPTLGCWWFKYTKSIFHSKKREERKQTNLRIHSKCLFSVSLSKMLFGSEFKQVGAQQKKLDPREDTESSVIYFSTLISRVNASGNSSSHWNSLPKVWLSYSLFFFLGPKFMVVWQEQRCVCVLFWCPSSPMFLNMLSIEHGRVNHSITTLSLCVLGLTFWLTMNKKLFQKKTPLLRMSFFYVWS